MLHYFFMVTGAHSVFPSAVNNLFPTQNFITVWIAIATAFQGAP